MLSLKDFKVKVKDKGLKDGDTIDVLGNVFKECIVEDGGHVIYPAPPVNNTFIIFSTPTYKHFLNLQ